MTAQNALSHLFSRHRLSIAYFTILVTTNCSETVKRQIGKLSQKRTQNNNTSSSMDVDTYKLELKWFDTQHCVDAKHFSIA